MPAHNKTIESNTRPFIVLFIFVALCVNCGQGEVEDIHLSGQNRSLETDVCEGDFDLDGDVDGADAATFKSDFGRSSFNNPCTALNPCYGDFDCDGDVDGTDAMLFKTDFGRSEYSISCTSDNLCNGDFDCDHDVDGTDAMLFKVDFGRSIFSNPCPVCELGDWCSYPLP